MKQYDAMTRRLPVTGTAMLLLIILLLPVPPVLGAEAGSKRGAVISLGNSRFAKLQPIPIQDVRLTSGFWADRVSTVLRETFVTQLAQFV